MKVKNLFLIAAGVFMLTTTFTATAKKLPKEVKMTKEVLMDKIKGGWAGKTIGCSYGGPTEFKYSGFMNDEIEIPWHEHTIKWWFDNVPGLYDDVYMDLTFVEVFQKEGLDAPIESFANAFAHAPYPKSWMEAFGFLKTLIESSKVNGRKVVFIDELPFMYTNRCDLVVALEHFWNDWGCTQDNLMLIVCGSATSWITKKILRNKGGLHNRVTGKIYLRPFNLAECKAYFKSAGISLDEKDIAECYMIMGGIPYYLSLFEKGKNLAQNVDEMFFKRKGKLDGEFDNLYASLFENSEDYMKVIEALSRRNAGLTRKEVIAATGLPDGGGLSTILSDLDDCDIIRKYKAFGKKENDAVYQLTDFYTIFYYKFIKKYGTSDKSFWSYQTGTTLHNAWAGIAFERLCMYHHIQIEKALGIQGIMTEASSWRSESAQIDLVISRADRVIDLCEIKFWEGPFSITKKYRQELDNKINSFRDSLKLRRTIHLVFITTYGLKPNEYSGVVQNEVTLKDLFE